MYRVFLDSLCIDGHIGVATVLYKQGHEKRVLRKYLGKESWHTVFEVEVIGMSLGAELIQAERGVRAVDAGADSQVAIKATQHTCSGLGQYLVDLLHDQISLAQNKFTAIQHFLKKLKREAAETFSRSPCYQHIHELDPSVLSPKFQKVTTALPCQHASLLIQLHTGHLPLKTHLHRIGKTSSPTCPACQNKNKTVDHFVLMCPSFPRQQSALE